MDQSSPNSRIIAHTTLTALTTILPPTPWVSLAEGLLFGLPAAVLMAALVTLRLSGSMGEVLSVFLGALGLHGIAIGITAGLLRICRPLPSRSPRFGWAVVISILPLARLGALLAERTHHRPLGAVAFASISLFIVLGVWACCARAFAMRRSIHKYNRYFGTGVLGALALVSLVVGLSPILSGLRDLPHDTLFQSILIDGLLGASLVVVGGFARFGIRIELIAKLAGPMALAVSALSLLVGSRSEVAMHALSRVSALFALFH